MENTIAIKCSKCEDQQYYPIVCITTTTGNGILADCAKCGKEWRIKKSLNQIVAMIKKGTDTEIKQRAPIVKCCGYNEENKIRS